MPLYRDGAFVADDWLFPADADPLPASGKLCVPLARFLAAHAALLDRAAPIGVIVGAGDKLDALIPDLARLALVVLDFPRYADGRPYSHAHRLRAAGFRGELRASGDVLRDQVLFMLRAGFDSLAVNHPGTVAALEAGAITAVRHHYQPALRDGEAPAPTPPAPGAATRPWLRRTRGAL